MWFSVSTCWTGSICIVSRWGACLAWGRARGHSGPAEGTTRGVVTCRRLERPRNTFMRLSMVPSVTIGEMGCCHNPRLSQLRICMGAVSRRSLVCGEAGVSDKDSSLCTSIQAAAQHPVMSRWPVGVPGCVPTHLVYRDAGALLSWCVQAVTRALYCGWCDMSGRIMVCAQEQVAMRTWRYACQWNVHADVNIVITFSNPIKSSKSMLLNNIIQPYTLHMH